MCPSCHIRYALNLEIAVELYLLLNTLHNTVLVKYHSINDLLAFLGKD